MKNIMPLLLMLLFTACSPTKNTPRNDRKVSAWMMANPGPAGVKCSRMFPVRDSSFLHTTITPGMPVITEEHTALLDPDRDISPYLTHLTDSLRIAILDSFRKHPIILPCPPSVRITDTIEMLSYQSVRDRAYEAALTDSLHTVATDRGRVYKTLTVAQAATESEQKWKRFWMFCALISGGYILLRLLIKAQWPAIGKALP